MRFAGEQKSGSATNRLESCGIGLRDSVLFTRSSRSDGCLLSKQLRIVSESKQFYCQKMFPYRSHVLRHSH